MKILVMSDSHGDVEALKKILKIHSDAQHVFFCGDGERDIDSMIEKYPEIKFHAVRGNCDMASKKSVAETVIIGDKKILIAHGHTYYVKSGLSDLIFAGKSAMADIVLFGHTHNPITYYDEGIHIINPGSAMGYNGTFCILEIQNSGILPKIVKVNSLKI